MSLTVPEAAHDAQCGQGVLYRAIKEGRLRARKAGDRWLIEADDLARWMEAERTAGGARRA